MHIYEKICLNCNTSYSGMLDHCPICGAPSEKPAIKKKRYSYSDYFDIDRKRRDIYIVFQDGVERTYKNAKISVLENWVRITEINGTQWIVPSAEIYFIKIKEEKQNA